MKPTATHREDTATAPVRTPRTVTVVVTVVATPRTVRTPRMVTVVTVVVTVVTVVKLDINTVVLPPTTPTAAAATER